MPWQELSMMDRRRKFVMFALREEVNVSGYNLAGGKS